MKQHTINRRTVLRGVGATMALPSLENIIPARAVAASAKAPRRLAVITQDLGVLHDTFFPVGANSRNYEMPDVLKELAPIRDDGCRDQQ